MPELDLDKLIEAMGSSEVGKNADSISELLTEANKIIGELDKILLFLKKLESSIMVSAVIKLKAKEKGIDLKPLTQEGIIANSDMHKQVLENINKLSQEQLGEMIRVLQKYDQEQNEKKK